MFDRDEWGDDLVLRHINSRRITPTALFHHDGIEFLCHFVTPSKDGVWLSHAYEIEKPNPVSSTG